MWKELLVTLLLAGIFWKLTKRLDEPVKKKNALNGSRDDQVREGYFQM